MRTVRSMLRFSVFRIRITSIITALPAPLSVAPVPACQESKCAPIITNSSFFLPPGISPTILAEFTSVSEACTFSDTRTCTGVFFSMMRAMRLYCSAVITNVGGASGSALLWDPACSALVRAVVRAVVAQSACPTHPRPGRNGSARSPTRSPHRTFRRIPTPAELAKNLAQFLRILWPRQVRQLRVVSWPHAPARAAMSANSASV